MLVGKTKGSAHCARLPSKRERERERDRQTDRQTDRQRGRETDRGREGERDRQTEGERERETERERQTERQREGETERERSTYGEGGREGALQSNTCARRVHRYTSTPRRTRLSLVYDDLFWVRPVSPPFALRN